MRSVAQLRDRISARRADTRRVVLAVLACCLTAGCDYPFQPFRENTESFYSMFGDLDLNADTQWVRVMPVRQDILLKAEPIDAVVTLQNLNDGTVVALNDSLFAFPDRSSAGVGVGYAHNFWTTKRLEPEATYLLKAARSDGATTIATVIMPRRMEITLRVGTRAVGYLVARTGRVPFVDVLHPFIGGGGKWEVRQKKTVPDDSTAHGFSVDTVVNNIQLDRPLALTRRREIRVTGAHSDWPFRPGPVDLSPAVLDTLPTNVEAGLGFVGGVETRTIPFHTCDTVIGRANPELTCVTTYNARSATIVGRVVRRPCGLPYIGGIRLAEQFPDGGADIRSWSTGTNGEYRFEGIEPGAELILEISPGVPAARLPTLAPGQRYQVQDLTVPGC